MISEEEPGDEEAPDELVTPLSADLLLVEGDEDDGVLEVTAGLGEGAGSLQHGSNTWGISRLEPGGTRSNTQGCLLLTIDSLELQVVCGG